MTSPDSLCTVCDFSRSFIRWRSDTLKKPMVTVSQPPPTTLNNVRMPLECTAVVTGNGRAIEFGLGTSCKTEQVFVREGIWMTPNADMCAVSSVEDFMVIKRWDRVDKGVMLHPPSLGPQPERQRVNPEEAFESHSLAIRTRSARRLNTVDEVISALSGDCEVVSLTSYSADGYEIDLQYPVKTVNFSERHRYYQVDTGPVLYFGESTGPSLIERLHLAFVAHLGEDWVEFIVNRPTPLDGCDVSVHHYSESKRVAAVNSLWVIE